MADRHKHKSLRYRPPEAERLWLLAYQEHTGRSMNGILTEAVRKLRAEVTADFQADAKVDGIQVTVTARELLDRLVWDRACDMLGLNPWAVNEGRMDSGERLTFTLEQARELGLLEGGQP